MQVNTGLAGRICRCKFYAESERCLGTMGTEPTFAANETNGGLVPKFAMSLMFGLLSNGCILSDSNR